jgi:hypothetical protein
MKRIIITLILSCAVLTAHAGDRYYLSGRYLYDSQTGCEVGYLQGDSLYDSKTGETIGYRSGRAIYSSRDGSVLGYCDPKDR